MTNISLYDILIYNISESDISGGDILSTYEPLTDSMFYIMLALTKPRHGYAIMGFIEEKSNGIITIGPASMYTIIKKLLKADWIYLYDDSDSRRKVYLLTTEGRAVLAADLQVRKQIIELAEKEWEESL